MCRGCGTCGVAIVRPCFGSLEARATHFPDQRESGYLESVSRACQFELLKTTLRSLYSKFQDLKFTRWGWWHMSYLGLSDYKSGRGWPVTAIGDAKGTGAFEDICDECSRHRNTGLLSNSQEVWLQQRPSQMLCVAGYNSSRLLSLPPTWRQIEWQISNCKHCFLQALQHVTWRSGQWWAMHPKHTDIFAV